MLKKEIRSHFYTTLIWLFLVSLARWQWYLPFKRQILEIIFLWLGGLIGTFLLDIDHLLYTLWIYPQELTSMRVKHLINQCRFKEVLILLAETQDERYKLPFHSAFFQLILFVVCFFVLTSTGNLFGAGLVMAMVLHLLKDEIESLLRGKDEYLRKWLFWQIRGGVSLFQQKIFVILMLIIFLGLNLLLI